MITFFNLRDENFSVEIDPGVDGLERLLPHGLAVHVENHAVTEHAKVQLVPLSIKHLGGKMRSILLQR